MSLPAWSAVIVNYNAGALLLECVASLYADTVHPPTVVVVVDNDSTDGSMARLQAAFPGVTVIDAGGNLGYARAANLGIAASTTPVVAVLNPDLVVAPGSGAAMTAGFLADADLAAVGPRVLDPDGATYPSARRQPDLATAVGHACLGRVAPGNRWTRRYRATDRDPDVPAEVDWVSGAAVWLRRDALDAVGGWDEGYFMYVEDVDLCWRLRAAGFTVRYDPACSVTHVQGATTAQRPYRMIIEHHRSWYRFTDRRWRGVRRLLLPFVAGFLALRAGVVCATRALTSRGPGRSPGDGVAG